MARPSLVLILVVVVVAIVLSFTWKSVQPVADRLRYPRRGFGAIWTTPDGYRVDTFRGLVNGRPIPGDSVETVLTLSDGALDTLYAQAIRDRIFDLPEPHPESGRRMIQPQVGVRIDLRSGWTRRVYAWDTMDVPVEHTWDDWHRLDRFLGALDSVVAAHPVYQRLPPPLFRPM